METLGGQDVHVWFAALDRLLPDSCAVAHCLTLLDGDEQRRYRAFQFDRDRHCFLVAHALLRMALSRYAPVDPREWVFDTNEYGRPAITSPSGAYPFKFSLSHTNGMVACAICQHAEVGVDVETVTPNTPVLELAKRYYAATEYDMLCRTPDHDLSDRFVAIWTLKEAYIKARGMGLSLPLDGFAFELTEPETAGIRFCKGFDDTPETWRFVLKRLQSQHRLALAVRGIDIAEMVCRVQPAEWAQWASNHAQETVVFER